MNTLKPLPLLALLATALLLGRPAFGAQAAPAAPATQNIAPVSALDDNTGFDPIFDGKTLAGWEGDPVYWRVENGCIVGEITAATIIKQNTFLIWRAGITKDFELKVEYRISAQGNSGINYRSTEVADQKWVMRGYQADIDGPEKNKPPLRHTGQNYEERGRTFLGLRGQITRLEEGKKPAIIGSLGGIEDTKAFINNDGWNTLHIIARGNIMMHILNGHLVSVVIDDDIKNRRMDGELGVQVHVGPPMKIEYRNFRLKKL